MDASQALQQAIAKAGGAKSLADALSISRQAIEQWEVCPPPRVLQVERITGVPRHLLRPDFYPIAEPERGSAEVRVA